MFKLSTTSCMASVWFCDSHQHRWYSPSRICPPSGRRSQLMEIRKLPLPAGAELWQNTFDWPDLAASTRACQFHSVSILLQSASAMDITEFPYLNPNRSNGSLNGSSIFRAESSIPKSSQTQPNPAIHGLGPAAVEHCHWAATAASPRGSVTTPWYWEVHWRSLPSQCCSKTTVFLTIRIDHIIQYGYSIRIQFASWRCYGVMHI